MDERGLTVDPFRGIETELRWWEKIGPTQKPSPYRKTSWTFYQKVVKETVVLEDSSSVYKHQFVSLTVYDGKASHPNVDLSGPFDPLLEARKGTRIATLNYEIALNIVTITDWEHPKWHDATPIREAFKVLRNSVKDCIVKIVVKDRPDSFWRSLGFVHENKGDDFLVYNFLVNPSTEPV